MAGSLNKVTLIGNVGKDPEVRTFQNGNRVASFSIATSTSWKDKATGEKKENTQWHNISVVNDVLVGIIEQYVKKGTKLYVEGALETRKWQDNTGADRYSTEVVLRPFNGSIIFLTPKKDGDDQNNGGQNHQERSTKATPAKSGFGAPAAQTQSGVPMADFDDDIPF